MREEQSARQICRVKRSESGLNTSDSIVRHSELGREVTGEHLRQGRCEIANDTM